MELLKSSKNILDFSWTSVNYSVENVINMDPIGCISYQEQKLGKIPDSILFSIKFKDQSLFEDIYQELLKICGLECIVEKIGNFEEYNKLYKEYKIQKQESLNLYEENIVLIKSVIRNLNDDMFSCPPSGVQFPEYKIPFLVLSLQCNMLAKIPRINIYCKKGTLLYGELLNSGFLNSF